MTVLLARKKFMTSLASEEGFFYSVTVLDYSGCRVIKGLGNSGYFLGIGTKGNPNKPMKGIYGDDVPEFSIPINLDESQVSDYFGFLDKVERYSKVKVTGVSKGKGFAGVVKRWGFSGGPRTRGQSDRERHPGSIGSGTTVGRVLKGLKMGGRMGQDVVTVSNLKVYDIDRENSLVMLVGSVPGTYNSLVKIVFDS